MMKNLFFVLFVCVVMQGALHASGCRPSSMADGRSADERSWCSVAPMGMVGACCLDPDEVEVSEKKLLGSKFREQDHDLNKCLVTIQNLVFRDNSQLIKALSCFLQAPATARATGSPLCRECVIQDLEDDRVDEPVVVEKTNEILESCSVGTCFQFAELTKFPTVGKYGEEVSVPDGDDDLDECFAAGTRDYLKLRSELSVHFLRLDALMSSCIDDAHVKQMQAFVAGICAIQDTRMQLLVQVLLARYPQIAVE